MSEGSRDSRRTTRARRPEVRLCEDLVVQGEPRESPPLRDSRGERDGVRLASALHAMHAVLSVAAVRLDADLIRLLGPAVVRLGTELHITTQVGMT